jgi:hypothetical protein
MRTLALARVAAKSARLASHGIYDLLTLTAATGHTPTSTGFQPSIDQAPPV